MLSNIKVNKKLGIYLLWLLYLTFMMSFIIIPGSQRFYTIILFIISIFYLPKISKIEFSWIKYPSFFWYASFAIYVNLSKLWSVYDYNETGITSWVINIAIALLCMDIAMKKRIDKLTFFHIFSYAGAFFSIVVLLTSPLSTYATDAFSGITGQYRTWIGEISTIIFCINFCLFKKYNNDRKFIVFMMLNIITVFASGARGALVLMILACVYFMFIEKNWCYKIKYTFWGILITVIIFFIVINNEALYYAFITRVISALKNDGSTQSINERMFFIQNAFNLFLQNPLFGSGVDSMRGYLWSINYWHITYSHCFYLELLSSYGIVGTGIFLFPIIKALVRHRKDDLTKYVLPVLLIGFIWSVEYYSYIFIIIIAQLTFYKTKILS